MWLNILFLKSAFKILIDYILIVFKPEFVINMSQMDTIGVSTFLLFPNHILERRSQRF